MPESSPWYDQIVFAAATSLECNALRRALPKARIVQTGVALSKLREPLGETVVSCGLAGGLRAGLPTGTLLIPRRIGRPDGTIFDCDGDLVEALTRGARSLGIEPLFDPLLTSDAIVNRSARERWAALGYAAADMESALIGASRIAAVRVVLDTPEHELSSEWRRPVRAMLKPWNWPQALWLAREAPRAARLAAGVIAAAQGIGGRVRITGQ